MHFPKYRPPVHSEEFRTLPISSSPCQALPPPSLSPWPLCWTASSRRDPEASLPVECCVEEIFALFCHLIRVLSPSLSLSRGGIQMDLFLRFIKYFPSKGHFLAIPLQRPAAALECTHSNACGMQLLGSSACANAQVITLFSCRHTLWSRKHE